MAKPARVTKQDFLNYKECFKKAWIFKSTENLVFFNQCLQQTQLSTIDGFKESKQQLSLHDFLTPQQLTDVSEKEQIIFDEYPGSHIADGQTVGEMVRDYFMEQYPQQDIHDLSIYATKEALKQTQTILAKAPVGTVIFEAAFQYKHYIARTDVLIKTATGWKFYEAKASTWRVDKPLKREYFYDVGYQYWVLTQCHLVITDVRMIFLNPDYVKSGAKVDLQQLFIIVDQSRMPRKKSLSFIQHCHNMYTSVAADLEKLTFLYTQYTDDKAILKMLAAKHCFNQNPADSYTKALTYCKHVLPYVDQLLSSVFTLKRDSHHQLALKLYWEYDIKQLSNLPTNFKRIININFSLEQNTQIKIAQAHACQNIIDHNQNTWFQKELSHYKFPVLMYDFETALYAIPVLENIKVYQQLPFQFSAHIITPSVVNDGLDFKKIMHFEYLATRKKDLLLDFIEQFVKLIDQVQCRSYVVYYKSFESGRLREMAIYLEDYLQQNPVTPAKKQWWQHCIKTMRKVADQNLDLRDFFTNNRITNSDFAGKTSIKNILNAWEPDFNYFDLDINKGDLASEMYRRYLDGIISEDVWQQYFTSKMLKYCQRDTEAMVIIYFKLLKILNFNVN